MNTQDPHDPYKPLSGQQTENMKRYILQVHKQRKDRPKLDETSKTYEDEKLWRMLED